MAYDETFQEIVDKTDMVELVSEFVNLEKAGANYRGLCPFHHENTPSFYVSPDKKLATCFGCHKSLDPIGFVAEIKKISFKDAALYCAEKAGLKVNIKSNKPQGPDLSKYYKIMDMSAEFYKKNLLETKSGLEALDYLAKRGLDKEIVEKFGIGLSPDKPDTMYQLLKSAGYLELDMVEAGLVKSNDTKYHDLFTKRIMFPIKDSDGHTIGYSGRIYHKADIDAGQPKYVNSNDNALFKKRFNLYNIDNAIPYANKMHRIILCEGQMDVIAVTRASYGEAVCSLGTSLTKEQAQLIKNYTKEVVLMYDNDKAGIAASVAAIPLLKSVGLDLKLIHLEGAKDADEYALKYGPKALKEFIDSHMISDIEFRYIAATYNKNLANENEFEEAKKDIFSFIRETNSATIQERYLQRLSNASGASLVALQQDFNQYNGVRRIEANSKEPAQKRPRSFAEHVENKYDICIRRLFGYATLKKSYAEKIDANVNLYAFDEPHFNLWGELYGGYYQYVDKFDVEKFLTMISKDDRLTNIFLEDNKLLSKESITDKYNDADLDVCIETVNDYALIKRQEELKRKIANTTNSIENMNDLKELLEITKQLKAKNFKEGSNTNGR